MLSSQINMLRFHQAVFKKIHSSQFLSNFVFKDSFGILNTRAKSCHLRYSAFSNFSFKFKIAD